VQLVEGQSVDDLDDLRVRRSLSCGNSVSTAIIEKIGDYRPANQTVTKEICDDEALRAFLCDARRDDRGGKASARRAPDFRR
jgi:hypothetical protein